MSFVFYFLMVISHFFIFAYALELISLCFFVLSLWFRFVVIFCCFCLPWWRKYSVSQCLSCLSHQFLVGKVSMCDGESFFFSLNNTLVGLVYLFADVYVDLCSQQVCGQYDFIDWIISTVFKNFILNKTLRVQS